MATDDSSRPAEAEPSGGLGLSGLSMNEIAPQATTEASEVARRTGKMWLWVILVLVVAAVAAFFGRALLNLPPGEDVVKQLEARPAVTNALQEGILRQLDFVSGNTLRADFSPNVPIATDADRTQLRKLTRAIMDDLAELLPGRDLSIVGFQDNHQMLESRYLSRSVIVGPSGDKQPDIITHIEGDPKDSLTQSLSGRTAGGE